MSENELEVYEDKKRELKKSLGLYQQDDKLSDDIVLSSFGTIARYVSGERKEQPFEKFLKETKKSIETGKGQVIFDKKTASFYLIDKKQYKDETSQPWEYYKEAHKLVLFDSSMEELKKGNFDEYTTGLRNLWMETEKRKKREQYKKDKEKEKNEIIIKANNNIEDLSPIEAKTYLDHLKKEDMKNNTEIAKKSTLLGVMTGVPIASGLVVGSMLFAPGIGIVSAILGGGLATFMGSMIEGFAEMIITDSPTFNFTPINTIKQLAHDIKEKRNDIKVNKVKEKELRKIKYVDKLVMPKSVTIEERDPIEELDLKDNIMNEIDSMVDSLTYVESEEKAVLLGELKNTLNTYIERKTNIINNNDKLTERDNLVSLRNDICKDLAKIEIRINQLKSKNTKTKAITQEAKLLTDKIDKVEKMKSEELNDMFEEEEKNDSEEIHVSVK